MPIIIIFINLINDAFLTTHAIWYQYEMMMSGFNGSF